ncbi:hypothetical protein [Bradyrhizobium retamae]|uniref:Uncharacterized protein n=1 Tax=Bradyrhizobium retamae TaxID=1300035 RepID=A0A0R3MMJ1_9BRAD|nr:hypothetical protein [Bradyrhizobium retamae]KRR18691.1 hypothetical protein CQ13_09535 [Bradyrhizobium retamae]
MEQPGRKIFTLDINGRPTLALQAQNIEFARGMCAVPDFRLDLYEITSDGVPICPVDSVFGLRPATKKEVAAFERAVGLAPAADDFTFVMLIKVDRVEVVAITSQADDRA